jgi:RND family efflux transporter MFP subunit
MKKKKIFIIFIVLSILIGILIIFSFSIFDRKENIEIQYNTFRVKKQNIGESIVSTGIIKPGIGAEADIGTQVSGVIKNIYINIGDHVKKGQIIVKLDDLEYQAKLELYLASLKKALADMEYTKLNLERQKPLLIENLISQQQIDQLENSYKSSEALYQQSIANVNYAKVQLSHTIIRSPINGVVASINKQIGESVIANSSTGEFFKIINLNDLEVHAYIDETDIGKIKEDLSVIFTVDTFSDIEFEGRINSIYPSAVIVDNVVNYIASINFDNNYERVLRPEMTADVKIYLQIKEGVLIIPTKSIQNDEGKKYVLVLKDGKVVNKIIKTGLKQDGFTEVIKGINEGEIIIIPSL